VAELAVKRRQEEEEREQRLRNGEPLAEVLRLG
jgi:hypothetical protein